MNGAVGFIVARDHLFHREADGRERVLHLVRHLARQKLQAFELAQRDQPFGSCLELFGHAVESLDGAAHFVVSGSGDARVEIARGHLGKAGGEAMNRAADAMRQIDQHRERDHPEGRGEQDISQKESAVQIALIDSLRKGARVANLAFHPIHVDIAEAHRINPDFGTVPHQILNRVALAARRGEVLGLVARRELSYRVRPRCAIRFARIFRAPVVRSAPVA